MEHGDSNGAALAAGRAVPDRLHAGPPSASAAHLVDHEQRLAVFDGLAVLAQDLRHGA